MERKPEGFIIGENKCFAFEYENKYNDASDCHQC